MRIKANLGLIFAFLLTSGCATAPHLAAEAPPSAAENIVQRQVEAYNAHDLDRFVAFYSDDIKVFRPPATEPAIAGKEKLREFYAAKRFNLPNLHADILKRIVAGNKVVDYERVLGVGDKPLDFIVVYEIAGG